MPSLDRVSALFPGKRIPDNGNHDIAVNAAIDSTFHANVAAELNNEHGYQQMNEPQITNDHFTMLKKLLVPDFETRFIDVVPGETLPRSITPPIGVGWIINKITLFPAVKSDFTIPSPMVVRLWGFDEVNDLYLPIGANATTFDLRGKIYGMVRLNALCLGSAGGTLLQPVRVGVMFEQWALGETGP